MPRYRIYDAHKLVTSFLSDFSSFVAKADFTDKMIVKEISTRLNDITNLINGHATHEEERIHPLLKQKGSSITKQIEHEHQKHALQFSALEEILTRIKENETDKETQLDYGRQFYLEFQRFEANNLLHQIYEETIIMPELQRLYNDEELSDLTEKLTYQQLSVDQIIEMLITLFPYYNPDDREATLLDLKRCTPQKFIPVWETISSIIETDEQTRLKTVLGII